MRCVCKFYEKNNNRQDFSGNIHIIIYVPIHVCIIIINIIYYYMCQRSCTESRGPANAAGRGGERDYNIKYIYRVVIKRTLITIGRPYLYY